MQASVSPDWPQRDSDRFRPHNAPECATIRQTVPPDSWLWSVAMVKQSWSERWLGWTGVDAPEIASSKLRSIRRLVLITVACEGWFVLTYVPYSSHATAYGLVATVLLGCAVFGWRDRFARSAVALAFMLLLGVVLSVFPENANHQFLALLLLILLLLGDSVGLEADRDAVAALQSMRWIAATGVFWAGAMKLYYGYWLEGEFLAYRIATDPGFTRVLGILVPESELSRLLGLGTDLGAGPFRANAPLLILVSNITWLAELILPLGLLWRRTRATAMVATVLLFVAIQLGAREVFFGGLMVGLLLLFSRRDRLAGLLPWITGLYVVWLLRRDILSWIAGGQGG